MKTMKKNINKKTDSVKIEKIKITALVKSMSSSSKFPENFDYRVEYHKHLEKKYK